MSARVDFTSLTVDSSVVVVVVVVIVVVFVFVFGKVLMV